MLLPASDMGIITTHLSSHDGMIFKFKSHLKQVKNKQLRKILILQLGVLRSHTRIMLEMMNPDKSEFPELPALDHLPKEEDIQEIENENNPMSEVHIALEGKASGESMAQNNFFSALKMKDPKVKQIHVEMALQQVKIVEEITKFLKEQNADIIPLSNAEEQNKVIKHFQHIMGE
ncbi:hypothetical protein J7I93_22245 [Bacillus sp. ISL-47]|uniref:hypothetical protein n=1 Tax=Bacillus sp. ISL-47 TaxID=2819130 RepID=UPI001BE6D62A|nr:hypothetical protein [Bacillus sp. ISL-47]MBT2690863.1 hypothetical protein [Bacillus sp. ISL-47]MBT2710976.1 hypothetical protein [Pseudomonas sp. ISL-84]